MERRWMSTIKEINLLNKWAYQTSSFVGLFHWERVLDTSELIINFPDPLSISLCIWDMIADELG